VLLAAYAAFVLGSLFLRFEPGIRTATNMLDFLREMVFILPPAFVLIGLFEVWVPKAVVERHLGSESGLISYLWVFLLAGTTVGGLYVAFPVAYALRNKGARLGVVFGYVGLSGICRVPMTLFEMSFLGVEFTIIRYLVGVPLVVLFSDRLGTFLEGQGYAMSNPEVG
jgi:uncharacterized membrane protein YraQ (UPF0718 family)